MMAFVEQGRAFTGRLEAIQQDLAVARHAVVAAGMGDGPSGLGVTLAFEELVGQASHNNRFVEGIVHDLRDPTGIVGQMPADSQLRAAILSGLVDVPTDRVRDEVVSAMTQGLTPSEAGLPELYFPRDYLLVGGIDAEVARLDEEREVADGSSWSPFDSDDVRLGEIDARLSELGELRSTVAARIGANEHGKLTELEAVAATGQWTEGRSWEGARFARWVADYRSDSSSTFDDGRVLLRDKGGDGSRDEFEFVAQQIDERTETAVGFYNGLGVEETAYLPTLLGNNFDAGDNEAREVTFARYSRALAAATRSGDEDGGPALGFGGDDLVDQAPPVTADNVLWYHPALLFTDGHFESRFLAQATAASLRQAESGPVSGTHSIVGDYRFWNGTRLAIEGGEDPRNVLLARSSQDAEAAALVVGILARSPMGLHPLLSPSSPFEPSKNGRGPADEFIPTLDTPNPVTTFLMTAGTRVGPARMILNRAAVDDRPFSDPGVAAGVDGVMASHATIMFDPEALIAVGMKSTAIGQGTLGRAGHRGVDPVEAGEWRKVHGKVLAYGRGQTLVIATHDLLSQAIKGAITDSEFHPELVAAFAVIAAAADGETMEAEIAYAAGLDDDAKHHNRSVNAAVNAGLGVVGLVSLPAGIIAAAASTGYGASDPTGFGLNLTTDNEINTLRELNTNLAIVGQDRITGWQNAIYAHMLNNAAKHGSIKTNLPDQTDLVSVPIRRVDGPGPTYQWQHPKTGTWTNMPQIDSPEYEALLGDSTIRAAVHEAQSVHRDYIDGVIASIDDHQAVIELRTEAKLDRRAEWSTDRVEEAVRHGADVGTDVWLAEG